MKILRSLEDAAAAGLVRPAVTLGVFDGVHLGHRRVIERVLREARAQGGDAVVVTFGRHPKALIEQRAPKQITSLTHRLRLFEELGLDAALVLAFDAALRMTPAPEFARRVFGEVLKAAVVVLGYDNRFGKDGEGDIETLRDVGRSAGFRALQAERVEVDGRPVSSTEIREAIRTGDLERAATMLGRPVSVLGTVVHGDGLGRQLGWPTANLDLHHELRPPRGVYGCTVAIGDEVFAGLANVGRRPTVRSGPEGEEDRVEVHVLDWSGDLYRRDLLVSFLVPLREEVRFPSLEALREGISADVRAFRDWLREHPQGLSGRSVDSAGPPA